MMLCSFVSMCCPRHPGCGETSHLQTPPSRAASLTKIAARWAAANSASRRPSGPRRSIVRLRLAPWAPPCWQTRPANCPGDGPSYAQGQPPSPKPRPTKDRCSHSAWHWGHRKIERETSCPTTSSSPALAVIISSFGIERWLDRASNLLAACQQSVRATM
jgi:hypothetical protein